MDRNMFKDYEKSHGLDDWFFDALKDSNSVVSGSLVLHALLNSAQQNEKVNWAVNDIDLYSMARFCDQTNQFVADGCIPDQLENWLIRNCKPDFNNLELKQRCSQYNNSNQCHAVYVSSVSCWTHMKTKTKFQNIILMPRDQSDISQCSREFELQLIHKHVENFDLECCANTYDGNKVLSTNIERVMAKKALINTAELECSFNRTLSFINHNGVCVGPSNTRTVQNKLLKRIAKYQSRGISFENEDAVKELCNLFNANLSQNRFVDKATHDKRVKLYKERGFTFENEQIMKNLCVSIRNKVSFEFDQI